MEDALEITGVDLITFAREVYALSQPEGMGMLHFTPGPLDAEEARQLVERYKDNPDVALSMDYVRGRACKMTVFRRGDRLFISPTWFDHSTFHLRKLLENSGLPHIAALVEQRSRKL